MTDGGQRPGDVAEPVPPWVSPVFGVLAALTVPWTAYLAVTLPIESETRHYRAAWVGFDLGLILLLLITAYLAWLGHRRVATTATATATMLLIDAWFDVTTSPARDVLGAIGSAILVELPLAALCLWISLHVDRVIARRLRHLARRAERASRLIGSDARLGGNDARAAGKDARAARMGAKLGAVGVQIEQSAAEVADQGVRVTEAAAHAAEARTPSP